MRDPRRAISQLLLSTDGKFAAGKDETRKNSKGSHQTNDRVEGNFGCIDYLMRIFRNASITAVSAMAQAMRQHDLDTAPTVVSDRRKRKHEQAQHVGGYFHTGLSEKLQETIVDYARLQADPARKAEREAQQAQDAERLSRREERVQVLLNKAVEQYAYAQEKFKAWAKEGGQRARTKAAIKMALTDKEGRPKPEATQLEWLRDQIEMRVLGCGWTQFATRWSSNKDSRIGTVAHLTKLLEEIIDEEVARSRFTAGTERGLPKEAAPPQGEWQDSAQLGTLDADAQQVRRATQFSREQLEVMAQKEMQRRVEAGIADEVETQQPLEAPAFDQQLVGKRIEVLWRYWEDTADGSKVPHYIWSPGTVKRVADGLTDKRSAQARNILPAGGVLWAWDADPDFDEQAGEQWLFLLPSKWNPKTHRQVYSWRYDPRELGAAQGSTPDERRKRMRRDAE